MPKAYLSDVAPTWLFEYSSGVWKEMKRDFAEVLEREYQLSSVVITYNWPPYDNHGDTYAPTQYEVDFDKMVQTNRDTGKERRLLRAPSR